MRDKKMVLIVEDDSLLNKMYKDALDRAGFAVLTAFNGEEGLKLINEEKVDLILLDLMMPKMDGFQVLEKMKENPKVSSIPVIILTNYGEIENIAKTVEMGVREFNIKSQNTPDQVIAKITRILSM